MLNTKGPHHDFRFEEADVKIFMFVRDPFTRERSIHRWLAETKKIELDTFTFEDYIDSEWFELEPSWYSRYGDLNNLVQHIDIADINRKNPTKIPRRFKTYKI
jgi:hypothetical protein